MTDSAKSFLSFEKGIRTFGEKAITAAQKELSTLTKMEAWKYVHRAASTQMWSQIILTQKFDQNEKLVNVRARLVANGNTQHLLPFQESSSPTITTMSLFMFLKIAATEKRQLEFLGRPLRLY